MTLLAPGFLLAALGAALAVLALHCFAVQPPRPRVLPTARFLPEQPVRAVATLRRPLDRRLLALRVLALLLLGAGFARPVRPPARGTVARVLLVDESRLVASAAEASDSVRRLARPGDALVRFDSAAAPAVSLGSAPPPPVRPTGARGSLSAALAAAGRGARLARARADSVELVLVSPLAREEWDAATPLLRAAWPGRVRLVPVTAAAERPAAVGRPELAGAGAGDPLAATHALLAAGAAGRAAPAARVVRGRPAPADSAWLAGAPGRALVLWPGAGVPAGWGAAPPDTVGAVAAGDVVVVAPFARASAPRLLAANTRVVARWVDGRPAATEQPLGGGCVRSVAVAVPAAGDLAIAPAFVRLASALAAPCGEARDARPLGSAERAALAGRGALAGGAAVGGAATLASPLAPWLLGGALLALLGELVVRRRGARPAAP